MKIGTSELSKRLALSCSFVLLVLLHSGQNLVQGQTAEQYLALLQEMFDKPEVYPFPVVRSEAERFLRVYPLHGSGPEVALVLASATLGAQDENPVTAFFEMAKTAQLFGVPRDTVFWISTVSRLVSRAEQAPLLSGLERAQIETLYELATKPLRDGPKFRRAFRFLHRLYQVRSKKLSQVLTDGCGWFLRVFPGSPCADTVRFWMANIEAERERHEAAASQFLALAKLYPDSKLAPEAVLMAAEEFCKRPVWRYADAADILQEYLDTLDREFRQLALQQLVILMEEKLHDANKAEQYFVDLTKEFNDEFELPEKVFRKVLVRLSERTSDLALRTAAKRYLKLYPEGKLAEKARLWSR